MGPQRFLLAIAFISLHLVPAPVSGSCLGCVDLDEITFDKLISRYPYALVKFDIAFPYGEKHEAFGQFALKAHQVTNDLLIGLVGVKDYGENENSQLAARFKTDAKGFPAILFFRGHKLTDYVRFPADVDLTVDNLKKFVTENSDLYIGMDGCLKEFSELVAGFAKRGEAKQRELLARATEELAKLTDETKTASGKVYVAYMRKVLEKGAPFVKVESARLKKLMTGKISAGKLKELSRKLNILQSFKSKTGWETLDTNAKTEL